MHISVVYTSTFFLFLSVLIILDPVAFYSEMNTSSKDHIKHTVIPRLTSDPANEFFG